MQHLQAASRELFKRTPDETFSSVAALSDHCQTQRENSAVHWFSPDRLHAQSLDSRKLVLAAILGNCEVAALDFKMALILDPSRKNSAEHLRFVEKKMRER